MKTAKEVVQEIRDLQTAQQSERHQTLQPKTVLALLSDLAQAVEQIENRMLGRNVIEELED